MTCKFVKSSILFKIKDTKKQGADLLQKKRVQEEEEVEKRKEK